MEHWINSHAILSLVLTWVYAGTFITVGIIGSVKNNNKMIAICVVGILAIASFFAFVVPLVK
jgi:hypothetical protein